MSKVEVIGMSKSVARLTKIADKLPPGLYKVTQRAVLYVHQNLPVQVPQPPGTAYRRTGSLFRSITTEVESLGNEVIGSIGSNIEYAPWVISKNETPEGLGPQAEIHQGRWFTLQEEVAKRRKAIVGFYRKYIQSLLKGA
jgi:hypothetical protein